MIHSYLDGVLCLNQAASCKVCNLAVFDWLTSVSMCQAYVFDGDIYYKPSVTSKALRLTSTNQEQNVVNGLSDWIYEGRSESSSPPQAVGNAEQQKQAHT